MSDFYDQLAPFYHLIFPDWDASMERQGDQLAGLIRSRWTAHQRLLDVSCGIGTQSLALAKRGFGVTGADLSAAAIARARVEAKQRGLEIPFSVCDMRAVAAHHPQPFDVVVSCDNALPHLLSDGEILAALKQMHDCLVPGGGCLLTVRDYDKEERGRNIVKPHGVRTENGRRFVSFQIWDFEGEHYDLTLHVIEEDLASRNTVIHSMHSRYYAVGTGKLLSLMETAGFENVRRLDDVFYQPVLIGTRPKA
jgi:SAM-dependent methyltransferase